MRDASGTPAGLASARAAGPRLTEHARAALRLLLPAAAALPLVILGAAGWIAWQDAWRNAERDLARAADSGAEFARGLFDAQRIAAGRVNDALRGLPDTEIRRREAELHARLAAMLAEMPRLRTIYVGDGDGYTLVSANAFPVRRDRSYADRPWHRDLAGPERPTLVISEVLAPRAEQPAEPFFSLVIPRTGTGNALPPGIFEGSVNISVHVREIAAAMAPLLPAGEPGDRLGLVRADGSVLALSDGAQWPFPTLPANGAVMAALAGNPDRTMLQRQSRDGTVRLAAMRRVPDYPVFATASRTRAAIVAAWWRAIALPLAIGIPATLLLLTLAWRVRQGQRALAESNRALEARVAERTAELETRSTQLARSEAAARDALRLLDTVYATAPVGLCVLDREMRYLRINARLAEINGLPPEAHLGRTPAEVVPGIADVAAALHRKVVETGEPQLGVEVAGETPAQPGVERTWLESWLPLRDAEGRIVGVNVVAEEVTGQRAADRALRASEERLRLAQDAGGIGSWDWNIETGALYWSESCHRLHGTDPNQPPSYEVWLGGMHLEDRPRVQAALKDALEGGASGWEVEFRFHRLDTGAQRWLVGRGTILRDEGGAPRRVLGVALDVTERHLAEERQTLLTRELDHRAKNALAVVQAALRLTPRDDPAVFAAAVEGRVGALARAHALFASQSWQGASLGPLVAAELSVFEPGAGGAPGARVRIEGPEVFLVPTAAQALAMACHELATNATKYGALSVPEGRLSVSWTLDEPAGLLRLVWLESGGPPVAAPTRRGFGSRVIEATVGRQLGGEIERRWQPGGLDCRFAVPLTRVLARGEAPAA
jgi:PAS domain S-box-containing protein